MKSYWFRLAICMLAIPVVFVGCDANQEALVAVTAGQEYVLNAAPSATSLGEAEVKSNTKMDVSIKGWADLKFFDGGDDRALFMLREILDDNSHGGESHDPSTCPFCKKRMEAAPKAAIVFKDGQDQILKHRPDQLFPIEHGDIVIVRGTAEIDETMDLMKVSASGIFVED